MFTANFRPLKATLSGLPDRTFMKVIVCANSTRVLGVHMCGDDAAEIIQVSLFFFTFAGVNQVSFFFTYFTFHFYFCAT